MFGELMNLGLTYKEAENFVYYISKMCANVDYDINYIMNTKDATLEHLIKAISIYGQQ